MKTIRTIVWVVLVIGFLVFSFNNWDPVEIRIWEDLLLVTKKPVLVAVSFLAGFLPVWLLHRGTRWQLNRRINSLETAVRSTLTPRKDEEPLPRAEEPGPPQI